MARDAGGREAEGNAFTRFFVRVDDALEPIFGERRSAEDPPHTDPEELRARPCPVCGHPISEHSFERSGNDVVMECPTSERLPERREDGPLNELGMPIDGR